MYARLRPGETYHRLTLVAILAGLWFLLAYVRDGFHRPHFSPDMLEVVPQYGPMILFFVTLVAGLVCIGWMVLQLWGLPDESRF